MRNCKKQKTTHERRSYKGHFSYAIKAYNGSGGATPVILNLGTRWWTVINFTLSHSFPEEEL